ncbi:MAG TPA: tyrosine--tRNA ligase, partial [Candidatus Nanoarchaeia archaeon]|nr:tyrosine--tRNA ligase [Candidatus Nanoarchaeia archaeon]
MDIEKRIELIKKWPTEEILTESDLRTLLENGVKLNHYCGFEVSGQLHIGQGIGMMQKVADLQKAGVNCSMFLADWHTWINNKLGGVWDNIQKGSEYIKEILTAGLKCVGGDPEKVKFIKGSDVYNNDFWKTMIDVSKNMTVNRALRSITIMGRQETELTSFAQLLYPPMQAADIFFMGFNLPHGGMDQRKIHVIARETAEKISNGLKDKKGKPYKPIALHT